MDGGKRIASEYPPSVGAKREGEVKGRQRASAHSPLSLGYGED